MTKKIISILKTLNYQLIKIIIDTIFKIIIIEIKNSLYHN